MGTLMLAVALLVQPADSVTVSGVVVDPEGKPVPDVEVVLAARRPPGESAPTLARSMTDDRGAFRLEVDRQRLTGIGPRRWLWAYRPGLAAGIQEVDLTGNGARPLVRLTLARPFRRTLTILDPDGRPLVGVRLAPIVYGVNGRGVFLTPDDWLARLTVVTGADGVVTLPYLTATVDPMRVRVTAPGIVPHTLPLPNRPGSDRFTLKIGRPARLSGSVSSDSGQPAANVPVEVWMENMYYSRSNPDEAPKPSGSSSLVHFDSGPIRTRADGSFRTPPQLMTGWSYKIIIRPEGDPPVSSDSLTAATELTNVPPLRLQQRRKLSGLVHDRQGEPVAGARVFLPSGEPTTTTDARGHFLLEGILPAKTYLLVQAEGFRLQGWPGIPARQPEQRKLILARTSEPSERTMAPLPAPISFEESRALARRVFEPYLQAVLEKGGDGSKMNCLFTLSKFDSAQVLELLEKQPFQNPRNADSLRITVASERIAADPVQAVALVEAISTPGLRGRGYARLAAALPASERDRKRTLLDRATRLAHGEAEHAADYQVRVYELGQIADGWLNLGEVEKARPLLLEAFKLLEAIPPPRRFLNTNFLAAAARIELERVLSLVKDTTRPDDRQSGLAAIAASLANDHPAEAERVFQLLDDRSPRPYLARMKSLVALRLCLRMAKTDPARARRIIAGLKEPQDQARAWALLALGLTDRDKPAARSALTESIQVIDRLLDAAGAVDRPSTGMVVGINPAALILPIVEKVAPDRVEYVFWRAVALMPNHQDDRARMNGIADPRIATTAMFLARYDRQVAAALMTQVDQALRSPPRGPIGYFPEVIWAKADIDPRGAVAMIEALPPGGPDPRHTTNRARIELATCLAQPPEDRWKTLWSYSGVDLD